jgi:hypothetical protein
LARPANGVAGEVAFESEAGVPLPSAMPANW